MTVTAELRSWATVRQLEYLDAVEKHGSESAAAKALGINPRTLQRSLRSLEASAAQKSASQHQDVNRIPDGFAITGTSTLTKTVDGLQWVKTAADKKQQEAMLRETIAALAEDVKGLAPLVAYPEHANEDLLAVYPWGDPHFGMYAWAQECGEDFDLEIAERLTYGAVDRLVASAPAAGTAIILPLGDFFHANDQTNQTPGHKHQLDVDTRFGKVLGVGIKTLKRAVLRALEKHPKVIVSIRRGNHDPEATWALRYAIAAHFENEPRVEVDLSPADHWFYRFGKVLIGATHGDTTKHGQLLGVMAADRPEDWGATKHRYFYTGHVHSSHVTEVPGLVCESFRTLAAKDAYAAGHGYRAGRDMRLIVLHREHGEIERHRADIGML
jgi:molybdenum-dependent DNA-binding transcriptional regulator ModE